MGKGRGGRTSVCAPRLDEREEGRWGDAGGAAARSAAEANSDGIVSVAASLRWLVSSTCMATLACSTLAIVCDAETDECAGCALATTGVDTGGGGGGGGVNDMAGGGRLGVTTVCGGVTITTGAAAGGGGAANTACIAGTAVGPGGTTGAPIGRYCAVLTGAGGAGGMNVGCTLNNCCRCCKKGYDATMGGC